MPWWACATLGYWIWPRWGSGAVFSRVLVADPWEYPVRSYRTNKQTRGGLYLDAILLKPLFTASVTVGSIMNSLCCCCPMFAFFESLHTTRSASAKTVQPVSRSRPSPLPRDEHCDGLAPGAWKRDLRHFQGDPEYPRPVAPEPTTARGMLLRKTIRGGYVLRQIAGANITLCQQVCCRQ